METNIRWQAVGQLVMWEYRGNGQICVWRYGIIEEVGNKTCKVELSRTGSHKHKYPRKRLNIKRTFLKKTWGR